MSMSSFKETSKEAISGDGNNIKKRKKKLKKEKIQNQSFPKEDNSFMTNNLKVKLPSKKLCASFCTDKKIHKKRRNTTTLKEKKSFKVKALSKVNHKKLSSSTKDIETSYLTIKTSHLKKNSRKSYRKNKNVSNAKAVSDFDVEMTDVSGEVSARNSTEIAYIYVVIDTNVFLDLDELKTIQSLIDWYPLPGKMFQRAIVVIPWVVLQELDHLKIKDVTGKKARRAINFIHQNFSKKSGIRGQSILEAATVIEGLKVDVNDDRLLQCCFFFCHLPGKHKTVLYSKDHNLCNKAMINQFETFTTFSSLVKFITNISKSDKVQFDHKKSFIPSNEYQCSSIISPLVSSSCLNDDQKATIAKDNSHSEILSNVQDCARDALSYILEQELINAFGKEIWKDVVKRKPPWSLFDIYYCMKKHWFPVFGMSNYDKIILHLIDDLMKQMNLHSISSPTSSYSLQSDSKECFITSNIELLRNLRKHHKKEKVVENSLTAMQNYLKIMKESCTTTASTSVEVENNSTSTDIPEDQNPPTIEYDVDFIEIVDDSDDRFSEEQCTIFWTSIDQVWAAIVEHCASIIASLNMIPNLNQIPDELETLLKNPSISLPHPAEAVQVFPLLVNIITSLFNSLKSFLSSYEVNSSPSLLACVDLIQTLSTITRAFNLQNDLSWIKPISILQSCSSAERRESLVTGFNKLSSVLENLKQCASSITFLT